MKNQRIAQLESIIRETLWMARRYAHGRSTYAPRMFNEAYDTAKSLGINIAPDAINGSDYADDGMFGRWNPSTKNFEKIDVSKKI